MSLSEALITRSRARGPGAKAIRRDAGGATEQVKRNFGAELEKAKIDEPKLRNIYTTVMKTYGYKPEEMSGINDYRLVLALQDAVAYRALKRQSPEVTKKAQNAPRLPNKQASAAQERQRKELDNRFKSGRAKLADLAAFLR